MGKQAFPSLLPSPVFTKVFQIFGCKNCKETIFDLKNGIFRGKNRPVPTVHVAGPDWKFERASALSNSPEKAWAHIELQAFSSMMFELNACFESELANAFL